MFFHFVLSIESCPRSFPLNQFLLKFVKEKYEEIGGRARAAFPFDFKTKRKKRIAEQFWASCCGFFI